MHPDDLRDHCLSFPGSVHTFPFGPQTSVFKVDGKIFALSQLGQSPLQVSLKCEPALAEQLRERAGRSPIGKSGQEGKVSVYEGAGHAFFADYRPTYRPGPAAKLWQDVVPFLERNLRDA